jgi:hypothetical protein
MIDVANDLRTRVDATLARLQTISESDASRDRGPGQWIRKEILGHLVDSAANNHQRFIRAQLESPFVGPAYEQDRWVELHRYRDRPWGELLGLWATLNRHLAHVIEGVPAERLATSCRIGDAGPVTLRWLIEDYRRHMEHHLEQIFSG